MNDRPRVSRFRLSLRAFMVLVLVAGAVLGWKANRARAQRRAVAAIRAVNGNVAYDFQYTGDDVLTPKPFSPSKGPSAPKWLRNLLGDEYFQEVTMVTFRSPVSDDILPSIATLDHLVQLSLTGEEIGDPAMTQVAKLPRLKSLTLARSSVTDAGLTHLAAARRLQRLAIHGAAGVTDAGMTSLAGLPDLRSVEIFLAPNLTARGLKNLGPRLAGLETLILYETGLSDEGMACLDDCRKLKVVSLSNANIGDAGFAHFRNMDSLKQLVVSTTNVTDEGLASLRGLKNLRSLSIANTRVTDAGLAHLEGLVGLESLMLQSTMVTDEGLKSIRKLKGLKYLYLGTRVSPEAIAALRAERPSLQINPGLSPTARRAPKSPASPVTK